MSKALQSIDLKFVYILYIHKDPEMNAIKYGNGNGFNRIAAEL